VVPLDKNKYGHFHSGDSYILLYVSLIRFGSVKIGLLVLTIFLSSVAQKNKRAGECNIHFWLGKETTKVQRSFDLISLQ
jgi:hypothetical protein